MDIIKFACVQLNVGADIQANLEQTITLIRQAAAQGAVFIATPENTCHMRASDDLKLQTSLLEVDHTALHTFCALAKELSVTLYIGSMAVKLSDDKIANRSFVIDQNGIVSARYDKIHLFDVDLPTGESHRESRIVQGGESAIVADVECAESKFKLGMSICYDVRFPYLYRDLAHHGANVLGIPAAFTVPTGQAHWKTLLTARAIENGAFVIAAAQCGSHEGTRKTYGHSMIIDPWGHVLAEAGDAPCVIMADIDLSLVEKARTAIPALTHDKSYHF